MARNKGSWNGEPAVPYYPKTKDIEAAKLLQSVAKRYAAEKANKGDVEEAVKAWHNATRGPAAVGANPLRTVLLKLTSAAEAALADHLEDSQCLNDLEEAVGDAQEALFGA